MKLRDFENRFEATLQSHKLEYTMETTTETAVGITWVWKSYSIKPRCAFNGPLLVTLGKHTRPGGFNRRSRTGCSCFVVPPHGMGSKAVHGLTAVWRFIRIICLPL